MLLWLINEATRDAPDIDFLNRGIPMGHPLLSNNPDDVQGNDVYFICRKYSVSYIFINHDKPF